MSLDFGKNRFSVAIKFIFDNYVVVMIWKNISLSNGEIRERRNVVYIGLYDNRKACICHAQQVTFHHFCIYSYTNGYKWTGKWRASFSCWQESGVRSRWSFQSCQAKIKKSNLTLIQFNILMEIAQYIGVIQLTLKVHHKIKDI